MPFIDSIHHVHLIGAGGIGISAVGKLLLRQGKTLSGSDLQPNEATRELEAAGAAMRYGHAAEHVPPETDLVIYSDAVPETNPERTAARVRELLAVSYFTFLGRFSAERRTVGVSGTNGKSTTTALLGHLLIHAGLDPTVIVGSRLRSFPDGNLRSGGDLTVIEACEYRANMLKLSPRVVVLTDIKEDHLDFYRDLDDIKATFQRYVDALPEDGLLVYNADDIASAELNYAGRSVSYAMDAAATYEARDWRVEPGRQRFELWCAKDGGRSLGEMTLRIPGRFNVHNALAATAAALELGADLEKVRAAVAGFPGIWRRFEVLGERGGAVIVSDYAHHPEAVTLTIQAAREFYPDRRVVACFQPHHRNRTRRLFDGFVAALAGADEVVVTEIYDVAGREAGEAVSGADLAAAVETARGGKAVLFAATPDEAQSKLEALIEGNDLVLVMGAGDIYKIAPALVS
jgi:UDP-N-acetylmuramate--alanine ligase